MFKKLENLKDVSPLGKWNVSRGENFKMMFAGCKLLKNGNVLKKWNFARNTYFESMFKDSNYDPYDD